MTSELELCECSDAGDFARGQTCDCGDLGTRETATGAKAEGQFDDVTLERGEHAEDSFKLICEGATTIGGTFVRKGRVVGVLAHFVGESLGPVGDEVADAAHFGDVDGSPAEFLCEFGFVRFAAVGGQESCGGGFEVGHIAARGVSQSAFDGVAAEE